MTTRRRKSPRQIEENAEQTMDEKLSTFSEEIAEVSAEVETPKEPVVEEVKQEVLPPPTRTPVAPVPPKKHPRNIPRFSRGRV